MFLKDLILQLNLFYCRNKTYYRSEYFTTSQDKNFISEYFIRKVIFDRLVAEYERSSIFKSTLARNI